MAINKTINVGDWSEALLSPVVTNARAPRRFLSPALVGVFGTILVHGLILPSAYWGSRARNAHPLIGQMYGAATEKSKAGLVEDLVLLHLAPINSGQASIREVSSLSSLKKMAFSLPEPPPLDVEILPLEETKPSKVAAGGSSDGAEQARLAGIYTSQIQARIDRLWRRPRSPVDSGDRAASSFQCQAQIVQDASGNVEEVLLPRCNGSPAWRQSLIIAIQQASPFPAPPHPSVFSYSIALNFIGLPYVAGAPDEEYELLPRQLAVN